MISLEMFDIMTFWLDEGVHGFRLHATERLYESASYTREVPIDPNGDMTSYRNFRNVYSKNLVSNFNLSKYSMLTHAFIIFYHRMNPMILFMQHVNMSMIIQDGMEM